MPTDRPVLPTGLIGKEIRDSMVILGIDAHKRTHTVVAIDGNGRRLASKTFGTTTADHLALLCWADRLDPTGDQIGEQAQPRQWAVEDCRHLSRRLERDLLAAGQHLVRVPPKLMAHVRDSARTFGKSDPIDALAVARAVLREPGLPTARLDGRDREVRLLVDHREALVAERTRIINRVRWYLHELDPSWDPTPRSLDRVSAYDKITQRLREHSTSDPTAACGSATVIVRLAEQLVEHARALTAQINELATELADLVEALAPTLLAIPGCGALTAAKIVGETAGIDRFVSKDAYARHNGTAPLPVWSSNKARHRLSRTGNRQLNAALHRIALTQARCHADAKTLITRRKNGGDSGLEALRVLKRHLSDVVYRALRADLQPKIITVAA
jgi:transposase